MIVRHRSPLVTRFPVTRPFDGSFDRVFEQLTQSFFDPSRRVPAVDASWTDAELALTVDLPGVPAEAVSVNVAGRALTLRVDTEAWQWERTVQLGPSVDPDKVIARHVDGRLTVTVGAVDAPEARSIAIDTAPAQAAIESAATESETADQSTGTSS
ncbi:MAG: Hsp20/alpha crystallin family protein, partial [Ilumatobacteraceae bacterium]